jgi:hypothetical protein
MDKGGHGRGPQIISDCGRTNAKSSAGQGEEVTMWESGATGCDTLRGAAGARNTAERATRGHGARPWRSTEGGRWKLREAARACGKTENGKLVWSTQRRARTPSVSYYFIPTYQVGYELWSSTWAIWNAHFLQVTKSSLYGEWSNW